MDLSALARPGAAIGLLYPSLRQVRVGGGQLQVISAWAGASSDPTEGLFSGPNLSFRATFDLGTGALVRQEQYPPPAPGKTSPPVTFAIGSPGVVRDASRAAERPFFDAATDARLPLPSGGEYTAKIAGRYAAVYSVSRRTPWDRGHGSLRVVDLRTGQTKYSVRARSLTRRAGASAKSRPEVTVYDDGSLGVWVPALGRRVRPVAVDARGRIRQIGTSVGTRGLNAVSAAVRGKRAIVGLEYLGARKRSEPDARYRVWVVDVSGRRGRRLATERSGWFRVSGAPSWWDGRRALWGTVRGEDLSLGLWMETDVDRRTLRRGELPRN